MDGDNFDFLFDAFEDAEPGKATGDALGIAGPFKQEDEIYDALGLQGLSFFGDQSVTPATSYQAPSPPSMDNAEFCIKSQESDFWPAGSSDDGSWTLEKLGFDDLFFNSPAPPATSPDPISSPSPFSPEPSRSSPSSFGDCTSSSSCSVQSPSWTYDSFRDGIFYDDKLVDTFNKVVGKIALGLVPTKEEAREFVLQGPKTFVCAVDWCDWHRKGWKREDRGIAHVLKEHFRVLQFPCQDCDRIYKWPHDLTKHRLLKHSNPGDEPPPQFACPEALCVQVFDKLFNLTRHRRNVHKKSGGARRTTKARRQH